MTHRAGRVPDVYYTFSRVSGGSRTVFQNSELEERTQSVPAHPRLGHGGCRKGHKDPNLLLPDTEVAVEWEEAPGKTEGTGGGGRALTRDLKERRPGADWPQ